jgi:alcohol dehydrogenase
MSELIGKFATTRVIHHGPGALARLDGEVRRLGGQHVGLITDAGIVKAGIAARVREAIAGEVFCYDQIPAEPPCEAVDACAAAVKAQGCDLIVALGGGSCIDASKAVAVVLGNGGSVRDYLGLDRVPRRGLPVIAIPTTAGTGSEVSPASVLLDTQDQIKKGVRSDFLLPEVAILDPVLTLGLPQALTASTGMDALTHAIECYTALHATPLSDMLAEQAVQRVGMHLRVAYANGNDLAARDGMLLGSLLAGMTLSIANVGAIHGLAQTLGGMFHVPHGVANAILLPYGMEFNRMACQGRYARVAELLGEPVQGLSLAEGAQRAIRAVRALVGDLGLPAMLRAVGIPQEALPRIAQRCLETQGRIVGNNPRVLSAAEAEGILQAAW